MGMNADHNVALVTVLLVQLFLFGVCTLPASQPYYQLQTPSKCWAQQQQQPQHHRQHRQQQPQPQIMNIW